MKNSNVEVSAVASSTQVICYDCGDLLPVEEAEILSWYDDQGREVCAYAHGYWCTEAYPPCVCKQCGEIFEEGEEKVFQIFQTAPDDFWRFPVHRECAHPDTLLALIGPSHDLEIPRCEDCWHRHLPGEHCEDCEFSGFRDDEIPF